MIARDAAFICEGDIVRPLQLWNRTTGDPKMRLAHEVVVHEVRVGISQTGIMFTVHTLGGERVELDAGWFR